MAIGIASGPATVVASGMATAFMGHDLVLTLDQPVQVVVELAFESDPAVEDVAVAVSGFANRLRLRCVNFDGADGRGSAQPVLVGEVGDVLVFLHFRVFLYGRTEDRTVHYTLYTVAKVDVDWQPSTQ